MSTGYNGISFPFRIGNKGGVVMSSTSLLEVPHIVESIAQILGTHFGERVMELDFGSGIDTQIFEPNDTTTHNLIKYEILQALKKWEPRVEVKQEDITVFQQDEKIYARIEFVVISYQTKHTAVVELGGENGV